MKRSIGVCILLSIITCGIYGLYWMVQLNDEVNQLSGHTNDTSGGMVLLLSIVTCGIYEWFWIYKMGEKVDAIKTSRGEAASSSPILYLLLSIFGFDIVAWALIQDTINHAVAGPTDQI